MDFLRSAYSTKVHMKAGDSRESTIIWYRAPDDALDFPEHHGFGSLNYGQKPYGTGSIGEIGTATRTWSNGATPTGILGTNFCGTASQYRGISAFRTTDQPLNANGEFACCASLCQEAYTTATPDATSAFWSGSKDPTPLDPGAGTYFWLIPNDDAPDADFTVFRNAGACGPAANYARVVFEDFTVDPPFSADCTLESYNATTKIGNWRIPAGAPRHPSTVFALHWPAS